MRKNIIFMWALLLVLISCKTEQTTYTINGKIEGNAEGKKVYLYEFFSMTPFDSTTINNNKFQFSGNVDIPKRVRLIIDNNPLDQQGSQRGWKASVFYLENSDIEYIANIDSMPSFFWNPDKKFVEPIVKGSKNQDLQEQYAESVKNYTTQMEALDGRYISEYHQPMLKGEMNTELGVNLINEMKEVNKKIDALKMDFIRKNASSMVALDLANSYFNDFFIKFGSEKADELVEVLRPSWQNSKVFTDMEDLANSVKKITIGSKYTDLQFLNEKNEKVNLSDFIQPGKYTLLEFWASWCGPCRVEIPHLKHVYNEYKEKGFNIVSISFDEKAEDWNKAKAEENMSWTQLHDPESFKGINAQTYKIKALPYSILIDKDGKIIASDLRGARLDAVLKDQSL